MLVNPADGRLFSGIASTICLLVITILSCFPAASIGGTTSLHPTQRPYRINSHTYYPIPSAYGFNQTGIASWYGDDFHGRPTSNGETYDMHGMTAAHKTLPMNTVLLVQNLENNQEIIVRVNDRGPFVKGRIIDLSYQAAKRLNIVGKGTAHVRISALSDGEKSESQMMEMAQQFYTGDFYVQIGSFANTDNALRLQNRFLQAGHKTLIQKYEEKQSAYYRVHVYVGRTLQGAEQARSILEKRGYRNAFVIAR
ncbi:septal ring lytic transglycosylase RlpA family protein [Desulfofustis glycolicus]|uniref:Probable endolytic peptidoglycan transglycosylase RlpA n=1 Tax=Desulfofustis glycolicus DSM 9705 TaxID=1121409 RepID=A0A1M5Y2W6_9BACT|nr:septal ring lytic transglycosylase RlpA family protein [Desulfofustis glycolicus]SHI06148.1 rare lipoprotein A [Desulfofustis glycolicus DSM 9705]